ncbi:unnamed protein product [Ostreobium quekettii]|uniref:AIG1-type G domain-containing protein n=1 Tax=Ostreobium quekettii TaxID=121088 RepID=A0A8S1JFY5_9CHLO|nr:unnamed protein product [Ostreobium quekettii]
MAMDAVKSGPEASGGASRDAVTGGDEHSEGGEEGRYDVDSEGGDLEEEDDDSDGGGGDAGQGSSTPDAEIPEWVSLENHPVHTSQRIQAALMRLANNNRRNLTILLLGRTGAGKSSTANSLFGSRMFTVAPFNFLNYMPHQPNTISKRKVGVVVTIIDSVGLVESDSVSDTVFEGITKTFGPQIWKHLLIGLTRSEVRNPSPYSSYDEYVNKRVSGIRAAMRRAGAQDAASIPYALIENSSRCRKNAENEQILPNGCVWVPNLVERAVDLALRHSEGYKWNPRRRNLLRKFLLIPLLFIGQVSAGCMGWHIRPGLSRVWCIDTCNNFGVAPSVRVVLGGVNCWPVSRWFYVAQLNCSVQCGTPVQRPQRAAMAMFSHVEDSSRQEGNLSAGGLSLL